MGVDITWQCDGCGKKQSSADHEHPPTDWYCIKENRGHYTEATICKACYGGLFKKRKKAA
jgi:hypothetical protein